MPVSPARAKAYEILLRVEKEGSYSSVLLADIPASLDEKDRSLCHELVLGTLRRRMLLDRVISGLSSKSLKKLDLEVLTALRIGLYQLSFLDRVPDHAAVNDSVSLTVMAGKRSARGFVNAILRKFTRDPVMPAEGDPVEQLSVSGSHPKWLLERWIGRFGIEETTRLVEFNNAAPPQYLRFTRRFDLLPESERESVLEIVQSVSEPAGLTNGVFRLKENDKRIREFFESGLVYFQDLGSVVVADSVGAGPADSVLDLCAAPGSKTSRIAMDVDPEKGMIVACDIHLSRLRNLEENCRRQNADRVDLTMCDAESELPFAAAAFDRVLVDAPCTGTGTIAQNPEIRYRVSQNDISELPRKQLAILINASKAVKPGGTLFYSTCSLEPEENSIVADEFLGRSPDFEAARPSVPGSLLDHLQRAELLPQKHATSGFFIAAFKRLS